MADLNPDSDYANPNLEPISGAPDTDDPRLVDYYGPFTRIASQGDDLVAVDSGAFASPREARYSGVEADGNVGMNHFQGVQRRGRYLFLSGGDSTEPVSHVFVIEMGTRRPVGPWGSNVAFSADPDPADGIVRVVALDRDHWHAGGISLLGDVLGVPLEAGDAVELGSRVIFLDVADPTAPTRLPAATEIHRENPKSSAVALARLPGGSYACAVWWDETDKRRPGGCVDVYLSVDGDLTNGFRQEFFTYRWPQISGDRKPSYQAISFLVPREVPVGSDGALTFYMVATENSSDMAPTVNGRNWADLYLARLKPWLPGQAPAADAFQVQLLRAAEFHCARRQGNFDAAAGIHLDVDGRLDIYTAFHWRYDGNIHLAEFHGLPAPESVVATLDEAWIELYEQAGFRGRCLGLFGPAEADLPDYSRIYVQGGDFKHVSSARFQIPPGTVYRLYASSGFEGDRPGTDFLDLVGTGAWVDVPDLGAVAPHFGDRVRSSHYLQALAERVVVLSGGLGGAYVAPPATPAP